MKRVRMAMEATPHQIWDVLSDGWLYPLWVVGATRMREVEDEWPQVGSRLHHSVGVWPLVINDHTEVTEAVEPRLLRLQARAWPSGEARVTLHIAERGAGSEVTIEEDMVSGPAKLVPRPVRSFLLEFRNRECLRRLALLAKRRA